MKELILKMSRFCHNRALGLLLIRIAVGMVFLMHGYGKVMNLAMPEGMMVHFGFPAFMGDFIAWLEVVGGLALIFGFMTRVFGVALGIEMVVAYFLTGGFGTGYKPHELELVLMLLSFGVALTGSGRYAVYAMECRDCGGMLCSENGTCEKKV